MEEPKFGAHSLDMLKLVDASLRAILAIESKHHRDNTEDYKKIHDMYQSLYPLIKKYNLTGLG